MPNRGLRRTEPDAAFSTDAGRALESVPEQAPEPAAETGTRQRRRPHLPAVKGQTTRITVDLPSNEHRALKRAAEDIADELDLTSVPLGQLMGAMAHQLLNDTSLRFRDSVTEYLRTRVEK